MCIIVFHTVIGSDCIIVITSLHKPAYSFMWEEPELKYTGAPIAEYQAHLALEPLLPDAMGSELSSYDVRLLTTQAAAAVISSIYSHFLLCMLVHFAVL